MLLLIDIGNTNIVVGCYENEKITQEARLATDALKTSDQYCMDLKNLLALYEIQREAVTGVIISSVVPPVLNSVRTAVMKLTGKKPLVVGPGIKTGLNILLDNPASVGSDLVVGAVAALHEYKPPLIMIDMGTATTIAVVDKNGAYIGGSICTGVKVATEALAGRAAQLPGISLDMPKKAIGRNTIDAMRSGIMLGNACMIDGMIERIEEELGQKATVVATGGIARFILPMCRRKIIYDRNLLLKGLVILYENNRRDNRGAARCSCRRGRSGRRQNASGRRFTCMTKRACGRTRQWPARLFRGTRASRSGSRCGGIRIPPSSRFCARAAAASNVHRRQSWHTRSAAAFRENRFVTRRSCRTKRANGLPRSSVRSLCWTIRRSDPASCQSVCSCASGLACGCTGAERRSCSLQKANSA